MSSVNEFPEIMQAAKADLASHTRGRFSPESWSAILLEAHARLKRKQADGLPESDAWNAVVLEFHREGWWGHKADWVKTAPVKTGNTGFGVNAAFLTFTTFVLGLMAVVWLGQIFTISDDPKDAYRFYLAVALVVGNILFFLWRSRNYQD